MHKRGGTRSGAGRPALPDDERRDQVIRLKVTLDERAQLDAWAEREDTTLSELARTQLLRAARRSG